MVITKSHIDIINCLVNGVAEVKLSVAEAEDDVAQGGRHSNDDEITAQVIRVGDFRVSPKKIEWRDDCIHSAASNNNKGVIADWIQLRWKPRDPMNDADVDDDHDDDAKDNENIYARIIQIGPRFFQLNSVEEKKLVLDTYNGARNDETSDGDASRSNIINPSNPPIASSSASASASSNNNNPSTNPDNTSMADVLLQLKQFAQVTLILHRQRVAWQTRDVQNNQPLPPPPTQHRSPFASPPSSPKEHEPQPNQYLPPPHIAEYEHIRQQLESASDPTPLNDLIKSVTRQNQLLSSKFAALEKSYLDTTSRLAALQTRLSNREKELAEKTMLIGVLETRAKAPPQQKFPSFADYKIHICVSVFIAILAILLWMWAF